MMTVSATAAGRASAAMDSWAARDTQHKQQQQQQRVMVELQFDPLFLFLWYDTLTLFSKLATMSSGYIIDARHQLSKSQLDIWWGSQQSGRFVYCGMMSFVVYERSCRAVRISFFRNFSGQKRQMARQSRLSLIVDTLASSLRRQTIEWRIARMVDVLSQVAKRK